MGRKSTVNDAEVFAQIGRRVASHGSINLKTVVEESGVSVGSLYHRYGSREGLMASAWLDAVNAFQRQFVGALTSGAADAGEQAAVVTPRFCREQEPRALILACCRRSEFLGPGTPAELREQIAEVNREGVAAVRAYARRTGAALEACHLGLVAFPLGAVRMYLPQRPVPESLDAYVRAAFTATVTVSGNP